MAAEPIYGPSRASRTKFAWSPDSKWLAYSLTNRTGFQAVWLYDLASEKSHPVTDGLVEAGEPVFDRGGKYLYFLASTDAGPAVNWFDQSFSDMLPSSSVYLVTLAKATANPLLKETDEEGVEEPGKSPESKSEGPKKEEQKDKEKVAKDTKPKPPVVIDLEGISGRVVALPIPPGTIQDLAAGAEGQIVYLRRVDVRPGQGPDRQGKPSLRRFDLKTREEETLAEGIDDFRLSADGKKILYQVGDPGDTPPPGAPHVALVLGIVDAGKFNKGDGALKLDAISVRVEPRAEWPQILREAWRINRDYFYAPNMHGADWNAMWKKYEALLPDVATRGDLNRVIQMMLSELAVGHSFLGGGERLYEPKPIPVGLLGADYDVADGRFRFKTIYGGAYWDPSLRAPLVAPGSTSSRAISSWRSTAVRSRPMARSIGPSRGRRASALSSRSAPVPTAPAPAPSWSSRWMTRPRCAIEPGWRAISARSTSGPRAGSPMFMCLTRPERVMITSNATSSHRPTRRRSSSMSGSTAAGRWPTTTSTCCAGRW